jgi:hypothetical protein
MSYGVSKREGYGGLDEVFGDFWIFGILNFEF